MMGNFYKCLGQDGYKCINDGGIAGAGFGFTGGIIFGLVALAFVIWTLYWKFYALWYAAKHDHKWWFIAMLLINSLGILEIAYLYHFSKKIGVPSHDEKNVPMISPQQ